MSPRPTRAGPGAFPGGGERRRIGAVPPMPKPDQHELEFQEVHGGISPEERDWYDGWKAGYDEASPTELRRLRDRGYRL